MMPLRIFVFIAVAMCLLTISHAAPTAGHYVGTVRITKVLNYEGQLTTRTFINAVAVVFTNGAITIMAAIPESPISAFDVESDVIRGNFQADGSCIIHGATVIATAPPTNSTYSNPPSLIPPTDFYANVGGTNMSFTLHHDSIPIGVSFLVQPATTVTFDYSFRRTGQ